MADIQIVMPHGALGASASDSILDTTMRVIAVAHSDHNEWAEKYGTDAETPVFKMHPHCWCEQDDCPYCWDESEHGERHPNFHYKPKDIKVWWYKHIGRGMSVNKDVTADDCAEMLRECVK